MMRNVKHRAIKNNLDYDLDADWFKHHLTLDTTCAATGLPLDITSEPRDKWLPSVDRIDNNKGYTKDNSRIVCWMYNQMRNKYEDEDIILIADMLRIQHAKA